MNIVILGSTGSIGTQSLEVIEKLNEKNCDESVINKENNYRVFGISAKNNIDLLEEQARKFKPEFCAVYDEDCAKDLKVKLRDLNNIKILSGLDGLNYLASHEKTDYIINAVMGRIGLEPTINALEKGKNLGLANKETLVAAGELVMKAAKEHGGNILPIDSEHCAIWQCIQGEDLKNVSKLILTASGGPFYKKPREFLEQVSVEDALKHPTWKMGKKISIDSATMMNKGLELIEACRLFDIAPKNVEILVHKESLVHSLVQFVDNAIKAQLSLPDMRLCIQYALTYNNSFRREISHCEELDLTKFHKLTFDEPDKNFIFPELARYAIKQGGVTPAIMNAANEVAVDLFLAGRIKFLDIFDIVEKAALESPNIIEPNLENIINFAEETESRIKRHFN